jgi:hypothetical protein
MHGIVETEFVRPLYNGENLLPFRITAPTRVVVPWDSTVLMASSDERIELYPGLADWWRRAEQVWEKNRSTDRLSLLEQVDYRNKLSNQFPVPGLRIVYNKSGMHLAAAVVADDRAVVNSGLYWATGSCADEAYYLCAILNAPVTTELVRPFMSYGKDERDIHKHVWELPIQEYDASNKKHLRLAALGKQATTFVANVQLVQKLHFAAQRRQIRERLEATPIGSEIDEIAFELLS